MLQGKWNVKLLHQMFLEDVCNYIFKKISLVETLKIGTRVGRC